MNDFMRIGEQVAAERRLHGHRTGQRDTRPGRNVAELSAVIAEARAAGLSDHDTAVLVLRRLWERR